MTKPIVITTGDPAGVGPDILLSYCHKNPDQPITAIIDQQLLQDRAKQLGVSTDLPSLSVEHLPLEDPAKYMIDMINMAVDGCLQQKYAAMVTGPVNKAKIIEGGFEFTGHTEYIAQRTNTKLPVMMLATDHMKVALVTTHLPLRNVAEHITAERLTATLEVLQHDLKTRFNIKAPRILVCGLNPHAGEDGHLGTEEQDIIIPTLNKLREQGFNLTGPAPADTAFKPEKLVKHDAFLAMYHDQGLPVVKLFGFSDAVNITLGLPIIRTSVDHGTAYEIAGTGKARCDSLAVAIEMAKQLINA